MSIASRTTSTLADFGTRSILTHVIMGFGFFGAVVSGLFVDGLAGQVSLVAFINFTAGMWICQSIHSLGNAGTDSEYEGALVEVLRRVQ
jgi:hypothetical protein